MLLKKKNHPGNRQEIPVSLPKSSSCLSIVSQPSSRWIGVVPIKYESPGYLQSNALACYLFNFVGQNQSAFSISQLKLLLVLYLKPINQLVLLRPNGEYSS